jgi:transcriptional regulator with XRE-family HTH domain
MDKSERNLALADFLRQRRVRLSPTEVGLPPGLRRRTQGLRREEVAQLANIGTSWYVWLEQGRDVHPSTQVLESLAGALRLTSNERRHLFLLAGQPLPSPALPLEECVSPELQQMLDDLNPTPACVIGRRWDYLAWNRAADGVFAISEASPPHARNMIWQFFTNPTKREYWPHWEKIARGLLAELRTASASSPGNARFEELIKDLKEASPEFCCWWPHHEASRSMDREKIIEHPTLGHLAFRHLTLQVFSDPDIRVTAHIPDAQTRAKLQRFRTAEESGRTEA